MNMDVPLTCAKPQNIKWERFVAVHIGNSVSHEVYVLMMLQIRSEKKFEKDNATQLDCTVMKVSTQRFSTSKSPPVPLFWSKLVLEEGQL